MLTKESKMRILENFYAIDYTLFGKSINKVETCCPATINEYVTVKGALLSVMIEMNKLVNHIPQEIIGHQVYSKDLRKMARESARLARENAKLLVATDKGKEDIKKELREAVAENKGTTVEDLVQEKIREKTFSLALDNLLIARTVNESMYYNNLNAVEGTILEDAYKVLRDSLVELAIFIDEYASITR